MDHVPRSLLADLSAVRVGIADVAARFSSPQDGVEGAGIGDVVAAKGCGAG
jgi:hypothetical protein